MRLITPRTQRRAAGVLALALSATLLPGFSAFAQEGTGDAAEGVVLALGPSLDFVGVSEGEVLDQGGRVGVRGTGGVSGLSLVLENDSGQALASSAGGTAVVLMTGPPEARRPWTSSEAAPGSYRLRARGVNPDQEMVEDAVRFEVASPGDRVTTEPDPGPFRAGFPEGMSERRSTGEDEPVFLDVTGTPAPGEDVLVVAWDPERLEMREDFTHVLDGPPWVIEGERLASLGEGEIELQVMSRRDGEVLGVARHPLAVTQPLSLAANPTPQASTASGGGAAPSAFGSVSESGGTEAVVAGPGATAAAPAAAADATPVTTATTSRPVSGGISRPVPADTIRRPGETSAEDTAVNDTEAVQAAVQTPTSSPAPEPSVRQTPADEPAAAGPGVSEPASPAQSSAATPTPTPTPTAIAAPIREETPPETPAVRVAEPAPATPTPAVTPTPTPAAEPAASAAPAAAPEPTPAAEPASTPAPSTTEAQDDPDADSAGGTSAEPAAVPAASVATPTPSAVSTSGFTSFPVASDARVLYVSSSQGSDSNNGLTPERPFKSVDRAKEFLRDGFPDRMLIKAGDVFDGPFGYWDKSGRSASQPMVVSTYGDGDRPLFQCGLETGMQSFRGDGVSHVMFQGFELLSQTRVPGSPDFRSADASTYRYGIIWRQSGGDVLFEDLKVTYFAVNMEITAFNGTSLNDQQRLAVERSNGHFLNGITINRCIFSKAYAVNGHSQGIFTSGVTNLVIRETVLDHNGWNSEVPGADRTIFNHNLYCYFTLNAPVTLEGNIITRAASHGAQVRPGGTVRDNFFARNALALLLLDAPSVVSGNVILESDNINSGVEGGRGVGIEAESCETVEIRNNLIVRKVGSAGHAAAIRVDRKTDVWEEYIDNFDLRATVTGNTVYEWTMTNQNKAIQIGDVLNGPDVRDNEVVASESDQPAGGQAFVNPQASVETYLATQGVNGGLDQFLQLASDRARGTWDSRWTAAGVNAHLKQGFTEAPFD